MKQQVRHTQNKRKSAVSGSSGRAFYGRVRFFTKRVLLTRELCSDLFFEIA